MDPLNTRETLLVKLRDSSDDIAWSEFVELYTPLIFRYCASRGVPEPDIPDVTQDTMRAIANAIKSFDYDPTRGRFRSWLYRVTYSKLARHFERANRNPQGTGRTTIRHRIEQEPDPYNDEARWDLEYKRQMFDWAVERIRPEFNERIWNAFWKTAVEEQSGEEVARSLNMTTGAVYVARFRVMARLRACVESVAGDLDAPPKANGTPSR